MSSSSSREDLFDFATMGGYQGVTPEEKSVAMPENAIFALVSGDPDFFCVKEGDVYVVNKQERGHFAAPRFASNHIEDVEKHLAFMLGNSVRTRSGLPRIWLPSFSLAYGCEAGRFRVEGSPADVTLSWVERDQVHVASAMSEDRAEEFVQYGTYSVQEIVQSFQRIDGAPLFRK
ncbi:Imm61 family immunity protein [Microbacterium hydrocarbonoxydans]|uniref:Imm61 family immunity protein n=1 Tax=Microbacterium hydrocarbonoxydans TaxID=273678 RepID=UPI0009E4D5C0|nr:Imm61 family immunity protein [Microbacterium hydrocarbonoxydans]